MSDELEFRDVAPLSDELRILTDEMSEFLVPGEKNEMRATFDDMCDTTEKLLSRYEEIHVLLDSVASDSEELKAVIPLLYETRQKLLGAFAHVDALNQFVDESLETSAQIEQYSKQVSRQFENQNSLRSRMSSFLNRARSQMTNVAATARQIDSSSIHIPELQPARTSESRTTTADGEDDASLSNEPEDQSE